VRVGFVKLGNVLRNGSRVKPDQTAGLAPETTPGAGSAKETISEASMKNLPASSAEQAGFRRLHPDSFI
jgi:hypothetical protein